MSAETWSALPEGAAEQRWGLERDVLGAALLDPEYALRIARKRLSGGDFSSISHRTAWVVLCELDDAGAAVTIPTVADRLVRTNRLRHIDGGVAGISQLADEVATAALIDEQAKLLRILALESELRRAYLDASAGDLLEEGEAEIRALCEALRGARAS